MRIVPNAGSTRSPKRFETMRERECISFARRAETTLHLFENILSNVKLANRYVVLVFLKTGEN